MNRLEDQRRPLIAVIGDASVPEDSPSGDLAFQLGRSLVDAGFRVLTGGLGGVMEAACLGARNSDNYQNGDTVGVLPGFSADNANRGVDIAIPTGLEFARNSVVALSEAVVAVGGGAGTLSEICHAWIHKRLIVALGAEGWAGRLAGQRLDRRVRYQEIPDDRIYSASTAKESVELLQNLLPLYNKRHRPKE